MNRSAQEASRGPLNEQTLDVVCITGRVAVKT